MRGTKVRHIRKQVYGDHSIRDREYQFEEFTKAVKGKKNYFLRTCTRINLGLRKQYQEAKRVA